MKTLRSRNRNSPAPDLGMGSSAEMKTVTLTAMRYRTASMLSRLRPGERVLVTKRGKPYAELVVSEDLGRDRRS